MKPPSRPKKAKVAFSTSAIKKICGSPREEVESANRKWRSAAGVTCPVLLNRRLPEEEEGKRAEEGMSAALKESERAVRSA